MKKSKLEKDVRDKMSFGSECNFWSRLRKGHQGLVEKPEFFIDASCMVGKYYSGGDVIDLINGKISVNEAEINFDSKLRSVLNGMLNVATGLNYLSSQEISHKDIRQDNMFVDVVSFDPTNYECVITIVMGDIGRAEFYNEIIKNSDFNFHFPNLRLESDINSLRIFTEAKRFEEVKTLIQKIDVYAFGKVLMQTLMGGDADFVFAIEEIAPIFKKVYGDELYLLCESMLLENYRNRPTFLQVIDCLVNILNNQNCELDVSFQGQISSFHLFYAHQCKN